MSSTEPVNSEFKLKLILVSHCMGTVNRLVREEMHVPPVSISTRIFLANILIYQESVRK